MRHSRRRDGVGGPIAIGALLIVTVALVVPACGPVPGTDIETSAPTRTASALTAPAPLVVLCPTRDAVSFETAPPVCAKPVGWDVMELVRDVGPPAGVYCWYRANVDGTPRFDTLPPNAKPDCPVVTPQIAALSPLAALTAPVPNLTRMPAGARAAAMAGAPPSPPAGAGNVHVAVLDTAPDKYDSPSPDNDLHGRAVARTIASLACATPASCGDRVENLLAMSYTKTSFVPEVIVRDTDRGGSFGTRAELAGQLRAVLDALAASSADRRQIINLSLGWEPEGDSLFPEESKGALKLLLRRAACLGALTVVAAGNGTRSLPLLPAAWEQEPAPDAAACSSAGFPTRFPFGVGGSTYRPLVYSVGAVDAADRPLATSRPQSLPRLVAYGMRVMTDLDLPGSDAPPAMSGTSMSAAITSAAAMAAWAVAPDLDPHDVMATVYDSAVDLTGTGGSRMDNRSVEQCLPTATPCNQWAMRRVSVCDALAAATTAANAAASAGMPSAPAAALLPVPACATVAAYGMHDAPPATGRSQLTQIAATAVAFNSVLVRHTPSSRSCPWAICKSPGPRDEDDLRPWTLPQPERPLCPTCRMTTSTVGDSFLWGSTTASTVLVNVSYTLDFVITPYNVGVPLPEQLVHLNDVNTDQPLNDWLNVGGPITSATARFEYTLGTGRVVPTQETPIDVDPS